MFARLLLVILLILGLSSTADATLSTTSNIVTLQGNNATTTFTYNFLIPNQGDLYVFYTNAAGITVTLLPTQYTVTGLGNPAGGTVTYPLSGAPIDNNSTITIERFVPYVQTTSISNQGPTFKAIEGALDYLTMQTQQLNTAIGQSGIIGSITGVTAGNGLQGGGTAGNVQLSLISPVAVANLPLGSSSTPGILRPDNTTITVNNSGIISATATGGGTITGVTAGTGLSGGGTSGTVTLNLSTPVAAANLPKATSSTFGIVEPDNSTITISGGVLSAAGATGCTAAAKNCVGWFNVVGYGADPTGSSDSTTAITAAISAASSGGIIYFPAGTYKFSTFAITTPNTYILGDGVGATILKTTTTSSDAITLGSSGFTSPKLNFGASNFQITSASTATAGYLIHVWNVQQTILSNIFVYNGTGTATNYNGIGIDCSILAGCYNASLTNVDVAQALHDGIDIGVNSSSGPPSGIYMTYTNAGPTITSTAIAVGWVSGLYSYNSSTGGGVTGWGFFPASSKWVFDVYLTDTLGDSASGSGFDFSGAGNYSDVHLTGSWGSSNTTNGLNVESSATGLTGLEITGGEYNNNGQFGIIINAGKNITINGAHVGNNSQSSSNTYDGIAFGGSATQFNVIGAISGVVGYPWTSSSAIQRYGLNVTSSSNNNYLLTGNILNNNVTAGLSDSGNTSKVICNNLGTATTANCSGGGGGGAVTSVSGSSGVSCSPTTGSVVCTNTGVTSIASSNTNASFSASTGAVSMTIGNHSIIPTSDQAYDLGSASFRWNNIHGMNIEAWSSYYGNLFQDTGSNSVISSNGAGTVVVGNASFNITMRNTIIPFSASYNVGGSANYWGSMYSNNYFLGSGSIQDSGNNSLLSSNGSGTLTLGNASNTMTMRNTILPFSSSYSVGNSSNYWGNMYANSYTVAAGGYLTSGGFNIIGGESGGAWIMGNTTGNGFFTAPAQGTLSPTTSGNIHLGASGSLWEDVWATNGTIQTSDMREKKNIRDSDLGLDFIRDLRPVKFDRIDEATGTNHYGFIAQDLDETLNGRTFAGLHKPIGPDGRYALGYDELIAPTVKAVQELDQRLLALGAILLVWNMGLTYRMMRRR